MWKTVVYSQIRSLTVQCCTAQLIKSNKLVSGRNKWSECSRTKNVLCHERYARCSNSASDHVKANRCNLEVVCWRVSEQEKESERCIVAH